MYQYIPEQDIYQEIPSQNEIREWIAKQAFDAFWAPKIWESFTWLPGEFAKHSAQDEMGTRCIAELRYQMWQNGEVMHRNGQIRGDEHL